MNPEATGIAITGLAEAFWRYGPWFLAIVQMIAIAHLFKSVMRGHREKEALLRKIIAIVAPVQAGLIEAKHTSEKIANALAQRTTGPTRIKEEE